MGKIDKEIEKHEEWAKEWAVLCKGEMDEEQVEAFLDKWEGKFSLPIKFENSE